MILGVNVLMLRQLCWW